jgi:tRNA A58 N-methylase Trm61
MKSGRNTQIVLSKNAALIVMFSGIGPAASIRIGTGTVPSPAHSHTMSAQPVSLHLLLPRFQKNARKNLEKAKLIDNVK